MFYILGLGNPGEKYEKTRHNVGRRIVRALGDESDFGAWGKNKGAEALYARGSLLKQPVELLLPETFMNQSGKTARYMKNKHGASPAEFIVVHDEVDLPLGEIKISVSRGAGGNNGVESIIQAIGKDFIRVRVGVARRSFWTGKTVRPSGVALNRHVLGRFTSGERAKLESVTKEAIAAIELIVGKGVEVAMNEYN